MHRSSVCATLSCQSSCTGAGDSIVPRRFAVKNYFTLSCPSCPQKFHCAAAPPPREDLSQRLPRPALRNCGHGPASAPAAPAGLWIDSQLTEADQGLQGLLQHQACKETKPSFFFKFLVQTCVEEGGNLVKDVHGLSGIRQGAKDKRCRRRLGSSLRSSSFPSSLEAMTGCLTRTRAASSHSL